MSETAKRDTAEMRYLLGDLPEDEQTRMEEAFFADDSKFVAVELAEDELVDAYVRDELSPGERQQFRAKLLKSPRLIERVNFAMALAEKAGSFVAPEAEGSIEPEHSFRSPAPKPKARWWNGLFAQQPAWGMALAACALLIVVAGVVLVSGWLRLRGESERLASEQAVHRQKVESDKLLAEQRTRTEQLNAELQRAKEQRAEELKLIDKQRADKLKETPTRQPSLSPFATVSLTPGLLRSGGRGPSKLTIGPATTTARIRLALEKNEYPTYNVTVKTVDDDTLVFRKDGLKPQKTKSGPQLLLFIPSRRLSPDGYIVHVDGVTASGQVENVNDYQFLVNTKK